MSDSHFHFCRRCGYVWAHESNPDWTNEDMKRHHTCQRCDMTHCTIKYDAAEAAQKSQQVQRNGPDMTEHKIESFLRFGI